MKLIYWSLQSFCFCLFLLSAMALSESGQPVSVAPTMGTNLSGLSDWETELPFVNIFYLSREWISQRSGSGWGKGPKLDLDAYGWIKRLEPGCSAETPMCTIDGGHYPAGLYTVEYKGRGEFDFLNARIVSQEPGRMVIDVNNQYGAFWLKLKSTDPNDYVRDIRVWAPGFGTAQARKTTGVWNPDFLKRWSGMKVLRFMDMQKTNNSELACWSDRPTIDDAQFTVKGAPIEVLCDLANRLKADPWFCVPHLADDEFVQNMARCIRDNLNPDRKVYLEYSNEVWNGQFKQCAYASEQGQKINSDWKPWEASWAYTAVRSKQIFRIFDQEFGNQSPRRVIRVVATQAANSYVSEQILKQDEVWKSTDVLAIAPYIMMCVPKEYVQEYLDLGLDGILKRAENQALPQAINWMKEQKKTADKYGVELACYEAGQHLVALWGANDNEKLNELFYAANKSQKLGDLYRQYYQAWESIGGGTLCNFSSIGKWSKWGCWGLMQYQDDDPNDYPKCQAALETARKWNGR